MKYGEKMKLLYFSTVNWNWIKQRPHFISSYLSKSDIEVDFFSLTPFLKQKISGVNLDNKNLNIKDKYVIPFSNKLKIIEKINSNYIKKLLNNNNYDIVILTHPFQINYITKKIKDNAMIIYECMDNMPYFYDNKLREKVIMKEKELCILVDSIIVTSSYLKTRLVRDYKIRKDKVTIIRNAVDISFLDDVEFKQLNLKHPNIMYIGTISDWFDYNTINEFAIGNPNITIYLIGPIEKRSLDKIKKLDNIKLIGAIEHNLVKSYILNADVMIIPFIVNDVIKGVDPVKMYEYLALNKQIVSAYWEELSAFNNDQLLYFYENYKEFEEKINLALCNKKSNDLIDTEFISMNNWNDRAKEYVSLINKQYK